VAIDIAKARHEVLIAIPGKKRRRRLTVLNQMEDFQRLITSLARYGRPVRAAFEATGSDHRALAYHLATAGFEVKRLSSVALARSRQALHNSWDKNDPRDAQVIFQMLEIGNEQFYHDPLVCGTNHIQQPSIPYLRALHCIVVYNGVGFSDCRIWKATSPIDRSAKDIPSVIFISTLPNCA